MSAKPEGKQRAMRGKREEAREDDPTSAETPFFRLEPEARLERIEAVRARLLDASRLKDEDTKKMLVEQMIGCWASSVLLKERAASKLMTSEEARALPGLIKTTLTVAGAAGLLDVVDPDDEEDGLI